VERPALTRFRGLAIAAAAVVLLAATVLAIRFASSLGATEGGSATSRIDARAPEGVRIRVEVLNASEVSGLARRATLHLRDRGFDVVYFGTERPTRDSTLVISRAGDPAWATLVARALGGVPVDTVPDDSRYLDVTVLLGPDWTPPPQPLYP
jgi:hypothetical protein